MRTVGEVRRATRPSQKRVISKRDQVWFFLELGPWFLPRFAVTFFCRRDFRDRLENAPSCLHHCFFVLRFFFFFFGCHFRLPLSSCTWCRMKREPPIRRACSRLPCPGTCGVVSGVIKLLVLLSFTISDRPHHSKLPGLWKSRTCHLFAPWFYRFYILMRFYFQLFFKFYSWGTDVSFDTWFRSSDQQQCTSPSLLYFDAFLFSLSTSVRLHGWGNDIPYDFAALFNVSNGTLDSGSLLISKHKVYVYSLDNIYR